MEKVIYAIWRRDGESRADLNQRMLAETAPKLLALPNVRGLRFNLLDEDVARAYGLYRPATNPEIDAAVQIWLDVSHDAFRASVDAILREAGREIAAWLVLESSIIPNTRYPSEEGKRTAGWSQFCFLQKPDHLDYDRWRYNWQVLHTPVAIETQDNFEYLQNLVVRPLIDGPTPYVAIVEECFTTDAMDDPQVFFNAPGDQAKFEANLQAMMNSCARFIDQNRIDVLPTSQYELRKVS